MAIHRVIHRLWTTSPMCPNSTSFEAMKHDYEKSIEQLGAIPTLIRRGDERLLSYRDGPQYRGDPDGLYWASSERELAEFLRECVGRRIPLTLCGSRTSITGSSNTHEGLLVAMEKMDRLLDIFEDPNTNRVYARAEPGILLGDFKRRVAEAGYFYPPDPTSYREAQLGGSVATNATGEDSLLYGSTRRYVHELKVLDGNGIPHVVTRSDPYQGTTKGRAGYCMDGGVIDYLVGSEGTLAVITEVTVEVLRAEPNHLAFLIPFPDFKTALQFSSLTVAGPLRPRACELIGPGAYEIFCEQAAIPHFPEGTKALIYLKLNEEGPSASDRRDSSVVDALLRWLELFYRRGAKPDWSHFVSVAQTEAQRDQFRQWRHYIPSVVNERAFPTMLAGGGKVSTDWWVPPQPMVEFMFEVHRQSQGLGVPFLVFAHIGNGHPHWNYLTRDTAEKKRVEEFVRGICRRVTKLGGGLAGEHGLGKIHHDYLELQHPKGVIEQMRALKSQWDPHWLLGRGNLFSVQGGAQA